jgi:hypothetical protein
MSRVLELLDEAHKVQGRGGFVHVLAIVQRKANRRALEEIARTYRRAADLVDEAAALLPQPHNQGDHPKP